MDFGVFRKFSDTVDISVVLAMPSRGQGWSSKAFGPPQDWNQPISSLRIGKTIMRLGNS